MQVLPGAETLFGVRAGVSSSRHAWGMGGNDIKTTGGGAEKKRDKASQADPQPIVG